MGFFSYGVYSVTDIQLPPLLVFYRHGAARSTLVSVDIQQLTEVNLQQTFSSSLLSGFWMYAVAHCGQVSEDIQ